MKSIVKVDQQEVGQIIYDDMWNPDKKRLFVHEFRTFEQYRGKGYFKLLLNEVKNIARELGVNTIALYIGSSETDEDWLEELYKRHGFENHGFFMELDLTNKE